MDNWVNHTWPNAVDEVMDLLIVGMQTIWQALNRSSLTYMRLLYR